MHLLPGFEFLKIKSVLYDTDNTPKNVTDVTYAHTHPLPGQTVGAQDITGILLYKIGLLREYH